MMNDYKELIKQLDGACFFKMVDGDISKADLFARAVDAIEQLVKERDAAICDIPHICQTCYGNNMEADCVDNPCWNCKGNNNPEWEWRGVQEDNDGKID